MRRIEVVDGPVGAYDVVMIAPDTRSGRQRVRGYLGVDRLVWRAADDENGLIAVAVRPGDDPDDARPMACLVEA